MNAKIKAIVLTVTVLLLSALFLLGSLQADSNKQSNNQSDNEKNAGNQTNVHKVAVIIPHPDDETIGMGGTIQMLKENGTPVHCVLMTSGNAVGSGLRPIKNYYNVSLPENASSTEKKKLIREDSFRRVMDLFGCDYETKGIDDGDLNSSTVFGTMEDLYIKGCYTEFYTVTGDGNPDHQACYQAMKEMKVKYPDLKYREFPIYYYNSMRRKPLPIVNNSTEIDVSKYITKKKEAFQIYYNINTIIPQFYPYSDGLIQASPEKIFYIN
jgi:LmbE family N-acetylglucosaminyl deacetylase